MIIANKMYKPCLQNNDVLNGSQYVCWAKSCICWTCRLTSEMHCWTMKGELSIWFKNYSKNIVCVYTKANIVRWRFRPRNLKGSLG